VEEVRVTALNIFQNTEPSRTQREGEAPAELALHRLRRSVALPFGDLPLVALPLPGQELAEGLALLRRGP